MAAATAVVKFDVTSNFKSSRKDMEREAVDSFRALERAEKAAGIPELGKRFGKAMADLNENLEHGEWMKTLERLGITYRKAQYWMHIYKGKTPTGSKNRTDNARFDWDAATDWLHQLGTKARILANPRSKTSRRRTSKATRSATSSRASLVGRSHSSSPEYRTTSRSGPGRFRASRSASRGGSSVQKTRGTSGGTSKGSSLQESLHLSLESRLTRRLGSEARVALGSTSWLATWGRPATRLGLRYSRLYMSE